MQSSAWKESIGWQTTSRIPTHTRKSTHEMQISCRQPASFVVDSGSIVCSLLLLLLLFRRKRSPVDICYVWQLNRLQLQSCSIPLPCMAATAKQVIRSHFVPDTRQEMLAKNAKQKENGNPLSELWALFDCFCLLTILSAVWAKKGLRSALKFRNMFHIINDDEPSLSSAARSLLFSLADHCFGLRS